MSDWQLDFEWQDTTGEKDWASVRLTDNDAVEALKWIGEVVGQKKEVDRLGVLVIHLSRLT